MTPRRRTGARLLPLFGLLAACDGSAGQGPVDASPRGDAAVNARDIVVMSFNIRWDPGGGADGDNAWELRRPLVYDLLGDSNLDVIALQESTTRQLDDVVAAVPALSFIDNEDVNNGVVYLYRADRLEVEDSGRFWFSATADVPSSPDWNGVGVHVCKWALFRDRATGVSFYAFDVHWALDAGSRELSAVLLGERLASRSRPQAPALVFGDFNAPESEASSMYLRGLVPLAGGSIAEPLVDSFRAVYPDEQNVGTFNNFGVGVHTNKIDYVFIEGGLTVKGAAIDRRDADGSFPSDHFPLTATIALDSSSQ